MWWCSDICVVVVVVLISVLVVVAVISVVVVRNSITTTKVNIENYLIICGCFTLEESVEFSRGGGFCKNVQEA
ncbi:Hypothetical predicted protein [Octopus vulgaris]|uniref:Uncharacterized protein n=1 Tax=Octopus vulgaris TaxID=6645 RepID=A0AA36FDA7_OCTVU|nr:Hypothetical predicted protein [Octopus vulgaris]